MLWACTSVYSGVDDDVVDGNDHGQYDDNNNNYSISMFLCKLVDGAHAALSLSSSNPKHKW